MGNSSDKNLSAAAELRRRAEERSGEKADSSPLSLNGDDTGRIIEELKIHQIELEMQNEELRRSQEELEKSRNNYAELYDFAPIGYFTFDRQGLIRAVNLAGAKLLGKERSLLVDKPFSRFIADEEGKVTFSQYLATVLQQEEMQRCEIRLNGKDGNVVHGQFQSVTLGKTGSKDGCILSSIVDGTVSNRLQTEVRDAREYAESIIETMRRPILVLDADLKVVSANPSFYYSFKTTPEETIGNYFQELGSRQWDIPELLELLDKSLNQNTGLNGYEVHGNFPAIGSRIILLNARRLHQKNNDGNCLILAMEDVTERKRTEEKLLQSGALQSAIFNSANFSSIATDAKGVIQIFNVGAEKMLGYTAADVMNKITPADISDPQELIVRAEALSLELGTVITPGFEALVFKASRGIEDIYELTYFRKDGSRFPAVVSVTALRDDQDAIIGYLLIGTDNTARKQAEEALLKAGALQSAIFNSANFSSIATDARGVIQIFNVGAEKMLGYTAAEVMNKITPADISDPQEVIARAEALSLELGTEITPGFEALVFKASRGIEDIYELTYIRKDGSRFPAVVSVTALRDDRDAIIGYLLIGTDNTARKQAEEALLKAGALQSAIFNSANFSSIATDARGVIQIFNVGAEKMLGYSAAEVMNKNTPADISDPQELIVRAEALSLELGTEITPGFEALVFKASRGIEDIYELTYIRKDGSRFPAVVSVTALRDDQDTIIGYLLIGTDNTARKEIEAEQKQLSQRLRDHQFYTRSLFECNIDAIMTADPFGIITDVNKQMEVLTGCTRDELIGAPFKNYFTDTARAEMSIKLVMRDKKLTDYELTARARDGRETVVSYNATTFYDRDRRLQGMFAAARDITERKRLDQVLQQYNVELERARGVAEKANLAKSEFLSSMSHELRSPLNAILGFAQLMESEAPPPSASQTESIEQILRAGWHLLKLIDEILDLAKVESRQVPLSQEPVSLAEVLRDCQVMIEPQAQKRSISMVFPTFDTPHYVFADRTRLKQVLINLLTNAIKYNSKQGKVEVTFSTAATGHTRVSIRDTGAGLGPEELGQLFHAFNRLGQEGGGEEGTGIGLVVAKQLVELMGGIIGVESSVGVGSVFWFELASVAEPQNYIEGGDALPSAPLRVPRSGQAYTLLYVEDNPANLKLVEQIIARHPDFSLLTAVNGEEGVEIARSAMPDVILMDINLPGINGYEALSILHSDQSTQLIPVIAISANAMPHDVARGLEAGFFRYLTKPINVEDLMEVLDEALGYAGQKNGHDQEKQEVDPIKPKGTWETMK